MKRVLLSFAMTAVAALASSCATAAEDPHAGMDHSKMDHGAMAAPASAPIIDAGGKTIGTVSMRDTPTGLLVSVDARGLPAGEHGFHFHQKGVCDVAQKFETAGGHFAPKANPHGLMSEGGPHGGDMPNQYVDAAGMLKTQVLNTGVRLASGDNSIADADGTALVIHAGKDDYMSQPSGNAGGRIACAVVSAPK